MVWQGRKAYGQAIADALRSGHAHLFMRGQLFGGFKRDAVAMLAVMAGIHSQDPAVRRVSARSSARCTMPGAVDAMVEALKSGPRRCAWPCCARLYLGQGALRAAGGGRCPGGPRAGSAPGSHRRLRQLSGYPDLASTCSHVLDDPHPAVRGLAAAACSSTALTIRLRAYCEIWRSPIPCLGSTRALAEWGARLLINAAAQALEDPTPAVRREAAGVLARIDPQQCLFPLIRTSATTTHPYEGPRAIGRVGRPAHGALMLTLEDPEPGEGALTALEQLPVQEETGAIRLPMRCLRANQAIYYHQLWSRTAGDREMSNG